MYNQTLKLDTIYNFKIKAELSLYYRFRISLLLLLYALVLCFIFELVHSLEIFFSNIWIIELLRKINTFQRRKFSFRCYRFVRPYNSINSLFSFELTLIRLLINTIVQLKKMTSSKRIFSSMDFFLYMDYYYCNNMCWSVTNFERTVSRVLLTMLNVS